MKKLDNRFPLMDVQQDYSSDGNLVNVGNCDAKGANVNRNSPDNQNDNLGASLSRNAGKKDSQKPLYGVFVEGSIFIQPPSMRPIS